MHLLKMPANILFWKAFDLNQSLLESGILHFGLSVRYIILI